MSNETITVSAENAARERRGRRSKSDNDNFDMITRSLASIRGETELGTDVDEETLRRIEAGLGDFYKGSE